jgi:hypothetical protein
VRATSGPTTVKNGGSGATTFNVGSMDPASGGTLAGVQVLTVAGGGADTLNVDDTGDSTPQSGVLQTAELTGLGMGANGIVYVGLAKLNLNLGSGGNAFSIWNTAAGTTTDLNSGAGNDTVTVRTTTGPVQLNGGGGTDTLDLSAYTTPLTWNLTGAGAGSVAGLSFAAIANLVGGSAGNDFAFQSGASFAKINGTAGPSTLDYSAFPAPVLVTVTAVAADGSASGTATALSTGFSEITHLVGGQGTYALAAPANANLVLSGPASGTLDGTVSFASFTPQETTTPTPTPSPTTPSIAGSPAGPSASTMSGNANGAGLSGSTPSSSTASPALAINAPNLLVAQNDTVSFKGRPIVIDASNAHAAVKVHLTASRGQFHLHATGVKIAGNDTRSLTLTGTAAALNRTLAGLSLLLGQGHSGASISVTVFDGQQSSQATIKIVA